RPGGAAEPQRPQTAGEPSSSQRGGGPDSDGLDGAGAGADDLAELYRDYAAPLSGLLRRAFGDGPPDPDDIAQEAFRKVIERGDLASIKNLKSFLWRTARNLVLNEKNREATRSRHDYEVEQLYFAVDGYGSTPETVISAREQVALINAALGRMPPKRRRAFVLHRVEGLTISAVGERLGVSRSAASKHISKAIADIDAALATDNEE
ncbi:MAG: sigma-70 family RNA polymerase sigma factor, partial [Pseudomonadota bacterium]